MESLRCSSPKNSNRVISFSKCPIHEPDHKKLPFCLWLLSWPTRLLPSGLAAASLHPQAYSFLCRSHAFLPDLLLRCLCTAPGRRHTSQHQPGEDPHLSGSMLSTLVNAFKVLTSRALNVNSSGLSLTITSEPSSGAFGLRTVKVFQCLGVALQHQGRAYCQPQ